MDATELAAFLRSRRDRIKPADVGLPSGSHRRVPGLRREEVAFLANASIDYYIELERARGSQPSAQMLLSLARALRLTSDERDHLFHLAGHGTPPRPRPLRQTDPSLLTLLERLDGTPARIVTDLYQPLAQNRLAAALLWEMEPGEELDYTHSDIFRWFTEPAARTVFPAADHDRQSRSYVVDLRATAARRAVYGGEAEAEKMIAELLDRSGEFTRHWGYRDVGVCRWERRLLTNPVIGDIELDIHHQSTEDGSQRLQWMTAPHGSEAAAKLALLAAPNAPVVAAP
ncbi:helix-turn-helix domain-containing protein [Glycomyces sp. NPDC021274]|uniref:MmyB family transcriptional regulator n=1 Tax=Glycomyces sp. NPDC021274 TaxID=3155120 RepID=UPI0033CCA644